MRNVYSCFHVILIATVLFLAGCGGDDFVAGLTVPIAEGGQDVQPGQDALPGEAGQDTKAESQGDAGNDTLGSDADSAAPEAEPDVEPDAQPEAQVEAASDVCNPGTCQTLGKNCGPALDGCGGTITSCGTCPANQSCGGGGVPNVCGGCIPDKCSNHGYTCGKMEDGCGNTVVYGVDFLPASSSCLSGLPPHRWYCPPDDPQHLGPPPFPDCKPEPGVPLGMIYCCDEAS